MLGWLLDEEISSGVEAMKTSDYGRAIDLFECADRIDARCQMVCFLHAVAIFKRFEQQIQEKQVPDLEDALAAFRKASHLLQACADDPAVGGEARRFLEVIRSYQAQFEAVAKDRARQQNEARPINELFEEFKGLMENIKRSPISSLKELDGVERKLKDMKSRAERLRRGASQQAQQALGQLIEAVDNNLAQATKLRSDGKHKGGGAPAGDALTMCIQATMALQKQVGNQTYFSSQDRQMYQQLVSFIRTTLEQARSETYDSQALATLDTCENILNGIERRL